MKLIRTLSEKIEDEISDAREYVKLALEVRDEHPELARSLYTISTQEMEHMAMLHTAIVDLIDQYRKEKGEPPEAMKAVYDYLHKRHIDDASEVKAIQTMYKGG